MASEIIYSVTMLNEYADRVLKNDLRLRSIKVSGEVSGFKSHGSGHLYFTLKDDRSAISCVMFRSAAANLRIRPEDGMQVVAQGYVSIYARDGRFQLYVNSMRSFGQGELYMRYLMLKDKLEEEGIFRNERPVPAVPRAIGIATSRNGAALQDMLNIIRRRFAAMRVILAPCAVQGAQAPREIVSAIKRLASSGCCDVIIVGRGGGSYEDLYCFNDEGVARAIAASPVPVISAVGHETDFTIADFAADLRAPTPSAAAELSCPLYEDLINAVAYDRQIMDRLVASRIDEARSGLTSACSSAAMSNPRHAVSIMRERLFAKRAALIGKADSAIKKKTALLAVAAERLRAIGPDDVLRRGYSIVTDEKGIILNDASKLRKGQTISLRMSGGSAEAKVTSVEGSKTHD